MRFWLGGAALAGGIALFAASVIAQEGPAPGRGAAGVSREEATRNFLGLGVAPDKAAAERGAPLFQQNCSFCHGAQARGAAWRNRRTVGYHGVSCRPVSHRQSGANGSMTHAGRPSAPARWPTEVSTHTSRSRWARMAAVS